jgi:hypothetical protein
MTKYLLVSKGGEVEQKTTKNNIEDEKIFKLCNYKSMSGFEKLHCFPFDKSDPENGFEIYGKKSGRANSENKYEFPPPIDKELYFGSLCIIKRENDEIVDLSIEEWNIVYENLFGGFEDIEDSDGERSLDSEIYSSDEYTKEGYHKDSFIIDDDELSEEEYE